MNYSKEFILCSLYIVVKLSVVKIVWGMCIDSFAELGLGQLFKTFDSGLSHSKTPRGKPGSLCTNVKSQGREGEPPYDAHSLL